MEWHESDKSDVGGASPALRPLETRNSPLSWRVSGFGDRPLSFALPVAFRLLVYSRVFHAVTRDVQLDAHAMMHQPIDRRCYHGVFEDASHLENGRLLVVRDAAAFVSLCQQCEQCPGSEHGTVTVISDRRRWHHMERLARRIWYTPKVRSVNLTARKSGGLVTQGGYRQKFDLAWLTYEAVNTVKLRSAKKPLPFGGNEAFRLRAKMCDLARVYVISPAIPINVSGNRDFGDGCCSFDAYLL
jgi:hypothetical protein